MKTTRPLLSRIIVVLLAAFTVSGVFAQGMRGPGPGPAGPDGPGPGGPLVMLLLNSTLHASLALDSAQEAAWTALQTAQKTLRTQGDSARLDFQAYVAGQFASGAPDLVAIEQAGLAQHQTMSSAGDAVSAQTIAFYNSLTTGQRQLVVNAAVARFQQMPQRSRPPLPGTAGPKD